MGKKRKGGKPATVEEKIDGLLAELQVYGFAVVKQIAVWRGMTSGAMPCPMCGSDLHFTISPSNGHMRARCMREQCLNLVE